MRGRGWVGLVVLSGVLGACLPDGGPVNGRRLLADRDARRPAIAGTGAGAHVVYETRKNAGAPQPWSPRLWSIPFAGGEPTRLAENGAWPVVDEVSMSRRTGGPGPGGPGSSHSAPRPTALVMHDLPGSIESPVVRWYPGLPAQMMRVDLSTGARLKEFSRVVDFGFWGGRLYVENLMSDSPLKQLVIEHEGGTPEFLVPAADIRWTSRREAVLLVPGKSVSEAVLLRVRRPGAPPEPLARGVSQFLVHPTEELVLLTSLVRDGGGVRTETRLHDLAADVSARMPLPEDCIWLGFVPGERWFACGKSPTADEPGRLYLVDLDDGGVRSVDMPIEDPRTLQLDWGPGRRALLHERGRLWVLDANGSPVLRPVGGTRVYRAEFSPDGRFVAYVELGVSATGRDQARLHLQDVTRTAAPRALTPEGAYTQLQMFSSKRWLLYVTHFGDYKAELFASDLVTGEDRLVGSYVGWWIWPWTGGSIVVEPQVRAAGDRVLTVVNWSLQDRAGDLVVIDLAARQEWVIAHSVADFATAPACDGCGELDRGAQGAVVIQERLDVGRDGLWAVSLP